MSDPAGQVTVLLRAARDNRPGAVDELIALIYQELRKIAHGQPALQKMKDAPQATVLVHEAYMRLFTGKPQEWDNRYHFFWAASRAMRDFLVEEARRQFAQKRGGDRSRVELSEQFPVAVQLEHLLHLDEVMQRLALEFPEGAEVVNLHFYGGLSFEHIAKMTGVSLVTIRRRWTLARNWLRQVLRSDLGGLNSQGDGSDADIRSAG
jgi:RNA polymerase sigma factor (TIGR02999 family)